ncbi:MAG: type II secretion system F family protein [Lachnospiraceae bacterium]|jgi:hypothetical protein|nr:type II secretion system F family protein [Lachnospiraceae bacterium]
MEIMLLSLLAVQLLIIGIATASPSLAKSEMVFFVNVKKQRKRAKIASRGKKSQKPLPKNERPLFEKSACLLYQLIFRHFLHLLSSRDKVDKYIGKLITSGLWQNKDRGQVMTAFQIERIRRSFMVIFFGNILALAVSITVSQRSIIDENHAITKQLWEQGSFTANMMVTAYDDEVRTQELQIKVEPISLSEAEVSLMAAAAISELPTLILGANESLMEVSQSLSLVERLSGYPFTIIWKSQNPTLVRNDGEIFNDLLMDEGEIVTLIAELNYQDMWSLYQYEEEIHVYVLPFAETKADVWTKALEAAITKNQQENAQIDFFQLPETVAGVAVGWEEKKPSDALYLWLLAIIAAFTVFVLAEKELKKKAEEKEHQIDRAYPELVRKLALYLGAGMTLRGAWKRTATGCQGERTVAKNRYLYEEMLFSVREMENGIAEREVYERFGKRVGIAKYRRLCGLLANHLQKGNNNLLLVLRMETESVMEDRRKAARAIGEGMSTKLLLPMMLMLVIVMIIIMIPAFSLF